MHDAIVENDETQVVPVGCRTIAGKGDDACQRARLGPHVAACRSATHTFSERAVDAGNGQRGTKMRIDVLVAISITQEQTLLFGTEIIIEREARAVGQLAARGIQSELAQELSLHAARTLGAGRTVARRGGYLIIHTLGIEIVALLHHLVHDLIHGVEARAHRKGTLRTAFHLRRVGLKHDACILQPVDETIHKPVLSGKDQRRKHRIVVVPAPALAQEIGVLHRAVGIDAATDGVDTHVLQTAHKSPHVVVVESRIHAAHAVHVAVEHALLYLARVLELRLKLIRAAQPVEGCDGCEQLHRAGRTHELTLAMAIDARVGLQVPHHDGNLRSLEHIVL